jgi:IclR family pca regulon transcriptional regulator
MAALTSRTLTTGSALQSRLKSIRAQGYAIVVDELEYGVSSIATPILDSNNSALAAINVVLYGHRYSEQTMRRRFLPLLRRAAGSISGKVNEAAGR